MSPSTVTCQYATETTIEELRKVYSYFKKVFKSIKFASEFIYSYMPMCKNYARIGLVIRFYYLIKNHKILRQEMNSTLMYIKNKWHHQWQAWELLGCVQELEIMIMKCQQYISSFIPSQIGSVKGIARIEFILNDTSYKFSFTLSAFPMSKTTTLEFSSCFQSDFVRLI